MMQSRGNMLEFKKFMAIWFSVAVIVSLLVAGGVNLLSRNRPEEEGNVETGENHFSVRWMGYAPPYNSSYPDYYVCVNNLKDTTLKMNIALQIKNQELSSYWFRIEEYEVPPAGWTIPTTTVGLIAVDQTWTGTCSANRTKPTSITAGVLTESINLAVRAYYDDTYTSLYSQDNFTTTFHFIDRTAGVWTELYYDNFDDGTTQGWWRARIDTHIPYGSCSVSPSYYRSYPYSLTMTSSGGTGYAKSFDVPITYQEAYLIFSVRNYWTLGGDARIFFNGIEYFRNDVMPSDFIWYQFSLPLPTDATTAVEIHQMRQGYCYLDDVYVIAK